MGYDLDVGTPCCRSFGRHDRSPIIDTLYRPHWAVLWECGHGSRKRWKAFLSNRNRGHYRFAFPPRATRVRLQSTPQ